MGFLTGGWMFYCVLIIFQILRKAKQFGDNPVAYKYARKKIFYLAIVSVVYLLLAVIIYTF